MEEENMYTLVVSGKKVDLKLYVQTEKNFEKKIIIAKGEKTGEEKKQEITILIVNINELKNNPLDYKAILNLFGIKLPLFKKIDLKDLDEEIEFKILGECGIYSPVGQADTYQGFSAEVLKERNE